MKLIAQLQLRPAEDQAQALRATMERANEACNFLSALAWQHETFGQYKLHKLGYAEAKDRFGLTAQVVVRCIAKVADAYKLDKNRQRTFKPLGSIAYDDRILRYKLAQDAVSIWTLEGRMDMPFVCGQRQRALLQNRQGESDLAFVKDKWYLLAVCNVEAPEPTDIDGTLGIDCGIVELATDSNGKSYSGAPTKTVRRRYKRIRSLLQKAHKTRKSKSAAKHLKRLSKRQANFVRTENHRISKQIVETARMERKALVLEDLKGIRERSQRLGREMRWQMGNWAFNQLQGFVEYKAKAAGVPVVFVEARNTSRTCSKCGHCEQANRKSQSHFSCCNCGRVFNADYNAALNIAAKGASQSAYCLVPSGSRTSPCL